MPLAWMRRVSTRAIYEPEGRMQLSNTHHFNTGPRYTRQNTTVPAVNINTARIVTTTCKAAGNATKGRGDDRE
jgi:hypothetical protein